MSVFTSKQMTDSDYRMTAHKGGTKMAKMQERGDNPAMLVITSLNRKSRKNSFRWKLLLSIIGIVLVVVATLVVLWMLGWHDALKTLATASQGEDSPSSIAARATKMRSAVKEAVSEKRQVWAESTAAKCIIRIGDKSIVPNHIIKDLIATLNQYDDMRDFNFVGLSIAALKNDRQDVSDAILRFTALLHTAVAGDKPSGLDVTFHLIRKLRKDWPVDNSPLTMRITGRKVGTTRAQDMKPLSIDSSDENRQLEYQMLLNGEPQDDGRILGKCSGRLSIARGKTVEIAVCFKDADFELVPINLDIPPPIEPRHANTDQPNNGMERDRTDRRSKPDPTIREPK
jgi:hypothetical protein